MANAFVVVQGADATPVFQVTVAGSPDAPMTGYLFTDVLTAVVWVGADQPVLFNPGPLWIDATVATFSVAMAGSQTATLEPGRYCLQVSAGRGGQNYVILDCTFEVLAAPGTAVAFTFDITFAQLALYVPQIRSLLDPKSDLTGFLNERHEAQTWFISQVMNRYRPQSGRSRRYMNAAQTAAGTILTYAPSPTGSWDAPSLANLIGYFLAGGLVIDELIRQCEAHYAASIVYLGQPGRDNVYQQAGDKHRAMAIGLFDQCTVELDTGSPPTSPPSSIIRVDRDVTYLT